LESPFLRKGDSLRMNTGIGFALGCFLGSLLFSIFSSLQHSNFLMVGQCFEPIIFVKNIE
jgi:hypothetical protein